MAKKRAYLKDFQPDVNGDYVYTGAVYIWTAPEVRRRALAKLWAFVLVMAAAALTAGSVTAAGMGNCAWVLLPYIAALIALVMLGWALWRLTAAGMEIRKYVYEEAALPLKGRAVFCCITIFSLLFALLLYLMLHGFEGQPGRSLLLVLSQLLSGVSAVLFCRTASTLRWEKKA